MTRNNPSFNWVYSLALVLLATALSACATINPISSAKTVEQKVYATYGSFVVFEQQAAALMQSPDVPIEVKRAIQQADAIAKPAADQLFDATVALIKVKAELAAGTTTDEKVLIATNNLLRWYADAAPKIQALVGAVEGAVK